MDIKTEDLVNLTSLLDNIYQIVKYQITDTNIEKAFNKKLMSDLDYLTSNINFTPKYIIFIPLEMIKSKYIAYTDTIRINKPNPIKIIDLKNSGFQGRLIIKKIEDIMIGLSLMYIYTHKYVYEYAMNLDLKIDITGFYLFYRDLYQKFIELNEFIGVI